MPRKNKLILQPLVPAVRPLVKRTAVHKVLDGLLVRADAHVLVEDQLAVERVQQHVLPAAEHHVARDVVDLGALDGPAAAAAATAARGAREGQLADEVEAVEVPEEGDAILGDGEDGAEGFGDGYVGDGGLVAE